MFSGEEISCWLHMASNSGDRARSRLTRPFQLGSAMWLAMAARNWATILGPVSSQSTSGLRQIGSVKASHMTLRSSYGRCDMPPMSAS